MLYLDSLEPSVPFHTIFHTVVVFYVTIIYENRVYSFQYDWMFIIVLMLSLSDASWVFV